MKLLTLNCHSWQEENQVEKIKYLANVIKEKTGIEINFDELLKEISFGVLDGMFKIN